MERIRTDVRRHKTEPKNYIALNRKKACAKNPSIAAPTSEAARPVIADKRVVWRRERDRTPLSGDLTRSIQQLASIISSGDLEKIIQLAKEIKSTSQEEKQPNQLQTPSKDYIKTKPLALPVRAVEPSYVHGLNLDNANAPKRIPKLETPIITANTTQLDVSVNNTEPYYGRGQGLRQLLELDNTRPVILYNPKQPQNANELAKRQQVQETEYYPWGKPGAGAPISTFKGYDLQPQANLGINQESSQVNSQQKYPINSGQNASLIRNSDSLRPEEERKRRASQYKLDLQAQVIEKERLKREEQERQDELERLLNERLARDQNKLLVEAERERERLNQKKHDEHRRFEYLQAKIEEQNQLALAEKERKKKRHISNLSQIKQNVSPITVATMNSSATPVSHSPSNKPKSFKPKKQSEQQTKNKQGQIRNPPPSQIQVIKSNKPKNSFSKNTKSSSMPTCRQVECDDSELAKNYLNVSSECFDHSLDMSGPSSVASLHDACTNPQPSGTALLQQQSYDGEGSINVIRQLQKLKQSLHVKQRELHSNYF